MSRRFLFLDDNPSRHQAFSRMTIGILTDHVWTAKECIETLLREEPYDCVFLDHDLGGQVFVTEVEGSGTEVAQFIASSLPKERYPKAIVVHSWNPDGALRMEQLISQTNIPVSRKPFAFS